MLATGLTGPASGILEGSSIVTALFDALPVTATLGVLHFCAGG